MNPIWIVQNVLDSIHIFNHSGGGVINVSKRHVGSSKSIYGAQELFCRIIKTSSEIEMNNLHQNNSKHTIKHVFTAFSQQKSGTNIQNFIFWWIYREIRKWKPKTTHLRIQRVRIFKILKLRNAFSMPIICVHHCTVSYFGTF